MSTTRTRPTPKGRAAAKRRKAVPLPVLLVVAVVALLGLAIALSGGPSEPVGSQTAPVAISGDTLPAFQQGQADAALGMIPPSLTGVDFGGGPVSIDPGGSPTVVIFAAHWCGFCQQEVESLSPWLAEGGAEEHGVDVIAVSTGVDPKAPNYPPSTWFEREGWPNPVLLDTEGFDAAQAYGLSAYPFFVFLDSEGQVLYRHSGAIGDEAFADLVSRLADA